MHKSGVRAALALTALTLAQDRMQALKVARAMSTTVAPPVTQHCLLAPMLQVMVQVVLVLRQAGHDRTLFCSRRCCAAGAIRPSGRARTTAAHAATAYRRWTTTAHSRARYGDNGGPSVAAAREPCDTLQRVCQPACGGSSRSSMCRAGWRALCSSVAPDKCHCHVGPTPLHAIPPQCELLAPRLQCVGTSNLRHFVLFLLFTFLASGYAFCMVAFAGLRSAASGGMDGMSKDTYAAQHPMFVPVLIFGAFAASAGASVGAMLASAVDNLAEGVTKLDVLLLESGSAAGRKASRGRNRRGLDVVTWRDWAQALVRVLLPPHLEPVARNSGAEAVEAAKDVLYRWWWPLRW